MFEDFLLLNWKFQLTSHKIFIRKLILKLFDNIDQ